ncbi:MAG: TIGR04283 family arsenosugar biosynthesis glycosyltransferase [Acidobacteriota bacterium]|nr:TIGR04283 family arsenosugar biosynthesis glycosyltransferase [Acidobacteriota bacterium]
MRPPVSNQPSVSIVVPVLDEADRVEECLARIASDFGGCELVVVDGGSTDGTVERAATLARVVHSRRGRGPQLNAGAAATSGDIIWFLHADTSIDPGALGQIRAAVADPAVVGGGLSIRFDGAGPALGYLAWSSNQRARRLGHIFGDQAMFVRRTVFDRLGGFADIPLMEDFDLSRRLRRRGRLVLLDATSTASARRFETYGTWRMIAFMQYLKLLFVAGVDPYRIAARYQAGPGLRLPAGADRSNDQGWPPFPSSIANTTRRPR